MSIVKTTNLVQVYEINGEKCTGLRNYEYDLVVESHHILAEMVILTIRGVSIAVLGSDLKRAIDNAKNAHAS